MTHIKVVPSPSFLNVLEELSSLPGAPNAVKDPLSREASVLTSKDVRWCHEKMKQRALPCRIHQLLNESGVVLPEYKPPPRSPELEARIQNLKAEQANREYRQMTKNLVMDQYEAASFRGIGADVRNLKVEIREMNRQLITGAQYLISIVGTFFGVFIGLGYAFNEFGPRVLFAILSALAVAVAEIYFIIRQDIAEEDKMRKKNS